MKYDKNEVPDPVEARVLRMMVKGHTAKVVQGVFSVGGSPQTCHDRLMNKKWIVPDFEERKRSGRDIYKTTKRGRQALINLDGDSDEHEVEHVNDLNATRYGVVVPAGR